MNNITKFEGIYTALLTPFDKKNKINVTELKKLIDFNLKKDVKGFYVGGSTAEAFILTTDERKQIMNAVKESAPNSTLIAHVGSIDERQALELADYAKKLEYSAISSVAPFYYKFSFEEIKNYYFRITNATQMPMIVYHFPNFSGVNMGVNEISEFLSKDNFVGIKYTSNDFFTMQQCASVFPEKIIFNGFDEMFLAGLSMGAKGGIGSTYNFMADKFVKIKFLFDAGNIEEAQKIQAQANKIITILCKFGVMQTEKEVLNQLGFDFGICRKPFGELTVEQKEVVAKEIIPNI